MWSRHASYALRRGVNTRKQRIVADVSGDTCEVVLRRVISSKESRLLTWQPNCQKNVLSQRNQGVTGRSASAPVDAFQSDA